MYVPPAFRVDDPNVVAAFMRQFEFAAVVTNSPSGLVASHVPVLVRGNGADMRIAGHLARANDHWKLMDGHAGAAAGLDREGSSASAAVADFMRRHGGAD